MNILTGAETRKYRLRGLSPLLGSNPASPSVYTDYIASKAPDPVAACEGIAEMLPQGEADKGLSVFLRDPRHDDRLILMDYVVRGFLKSALEATKSVSGIRAGRNKVDTFAFVSPRFLPILRDGKPLLEEDENNERALRASTMQGPRVSIKASECVLDPWELEFSITLLKNEPTRLSPALNWDILEGALAYGQFQGLGEWRSGGWGRFAYERLA